jgi:tetratricopeptide (TPR) repeat protein
MDSKDRKQPTRTRFDIRNVFKTTVLAGDWMIPSVFLLALALRLIYLYAIIDEPVTHLLLGDAESYDAWAREIVGTGWIGQRTFYQAPFYPYVLALLYTMGGRDFILVRLVQSLIGAFSCALLAGAGARFFGRKTGWITGILCSIYPMALFFDLLIQKAVLGMFFMSAVLFLMGMAIHHQHSDKARCGLWLLMGTVLACFALTRENALVLIPAVGCWLLVSFRHNGWRKLGVKGLFLGIGLAVIFLPVTLRNYRVGGEFVLTTSQLGPNFYIGNSKTATGLYRPLVWDRSDWKYERSDARELAEKALGHKLTPNAVSRYWLAQALSDIREDPGRWLRLMGKKWLLAINSVEMSDSESHYAHFRYSHLLKVVGTVFHYGVLAPLAIMGVFLTLQDRKKFWGLYWVWFCFMASVVLFFIFDRYRHPATAVMILFAAAALVRGYQYIRIRRFNPLAKAALAALPVAVIVNWPMVPAARMEAPTHFNIGYELEKRDELVQAKAYYQRSLTLDDSNVLVYNNLGSVAMKQNRPQDAITYFDAAVTKKPDYWEARVNLGIALWRLDRKAEAVRQYERVLEAKPDYNPTLYYNIACFHALGGRTEIGFAWLRRALAHGYEKWHLIEKDPDLNNLRGQPEFSEIMKRKP